VYTNARYGRKVKLETGFWATFGQARKSKQGTAAFADAIDTEVSVALFHRDV
jgi:hypothetical protein